ncbi:hypothetical protein [Ferruginivarius sediminum]|uniref:Uncharacterized protein n=1 Tax=Ferruginivarius sediminum TaxID=2661937 RepID=A0A369T6Q7_9PROT|nr:hypothetical protein [Ferruginivarius sediminum]RDD61009.1 hypothetical protein DRB17_14885 [Ferruginivarius sediminum]
MYTEYAYPAAAPTAAKALPENGLRLVSEPETVAHLEPLATEAALRAFAGGGNGQAEGQEADYRVTFEPEATPHLTPLAAEAGFAQPAGGEREGELRIVSEPESEPHLPPVQAQAAAAAQPEPAEGEEGESALSDLFDIVRRVAEQHNGEAGYGHTAADEAGSGLVYGIARFRQASGDLGAVLSLARERDPDLFGEVMGAENAGQLIQVTTASDPAARLQPVGGEPLTSAGWQRRFADTATVDIFRNAQHEHAIEGLLRPLSRLLADFGLRSRFALAAAFDLMVMRGPQAARNAIAEALGLFTAETQQRTALAALNHADLRGFQAANGISASGQADAATLARLTRRVRERGLMPLPKESELLARLAAIGDAARQRRLAALRAAFTTPGR